MGQRGDRFRLRAVKQKESKARNGPKKAAERVRREARMLAALKTAKPPYGKVLRNWLAVQLGKPECKVTADDALRLLRSSQA
jgi:hypothetical protein